jgi:putative transposase
VSPDRRRRAVGVLQQRFGVSQRRACAVVSQHRSTQRRRPRPPSEMQTSVRVRLRQIAGAYPRWGWRKAYWLLRREGLMVNRKRIRRYWAQEGLTRPARTRKNNGWDRSAATAGLSSRRQHRWPPDPVLHRG